MMLYVHVDERPQGKKGVRTTKKFVHVKCRVNITYNTNKKAQAARSHNRRLLMHIGHFLLSCFRRFFD